ncbi:MAG: acyltransferase [Acidimicrobiales bacterium]|nr:acyltransferase [Acidimicrobiales bacterium]
MTTRYPGVAALVRTEPSPPSDSFSAPPTEQRSPGRETGGLRRFSALDGIRALAVAAVLLYHGGISWMGGGLLGVDVFFVLSGFLITSLLCRELERSGTVRLGRFWAQRARRLLPALIITLLGVAAYALLLRDSVDVTAIRGDAVSTLLYVANWHFILADQGYFVQAAAPSPLLHTWSLAVEEQYYLIWPLVALFVVRRWGIRALAVTAAAGAVASAVVMVTLHAGGVSIDRLYYGTDTRAQALLVGSFLGAVGTHGGSGFTILPARWSSTRRRRWLWTTVGALGGLYLVWAWHALQGSNPFLYGGGFLLVAVAAGAVVTGCVTVQDSWLSRLLSVSALVFVGRISYGLYLYHWPLFLVIDHAHTGLTGTGLLVVRLGVTVAVATASFFLVEEPIRRGMAWRGRRGRWLVGGVALFTAATVIAATAPPATDANASQRGSGLTALQRRSLVAAGAFTSHPVRFILFGDSMALTLEVGLNVDSVSRYGVKLLNGAWYGCELDNVDVNVSGVVNPATQGCTGWQSLWPNLMARSRPKVTGLMLGRWEVTDHLYQGHWVHVGDPTWDRHLTAELNQAVGILSAGGAKVVLFTMPYLQPPTERPDGTPYSENDPARVKAFNRLLYGVAAAHKGTVTLIDLNRLVDPLGRYQRVIGGVTIRWTDGIHLTRAAGVWLQPDILPTIGELGLSARAP